MLIESILKEKGVIRSGHFLLSSGLHSAIYFEKFRILENPDLVIMFCKMIVDYFRKHNISIVCGPTTGGVIIAYEAARQLNVKCIFAETAPSPQKGRVIRRGFTIHPEDRVLIVDDILTTGSSINDTLSALDTYSATIIGIGVFIDRKTNPVTFYQDNKILELYACYQIPVENYPPESCPLCKMNIPIEKPGSKMI
ncbi:MAG: phosphoribosyltransferase family protein [candidate division WOR-3 bacterium]|nr:phosphoribosyltransferase family protein [candidate division WOR-3 bacterium]